MCVIVKHNLNGVQNNLFHSCFCTPDICWFCLCSNLDPTSGKSSSFFRSWIIILHLSPCFLGGVNSTIGLQGWLGVLIWSIRIHCDHFMGVCVNNVSFNFMTYGLLLELLGGVVLQLPVVVFSIIGNILPKNKVKMEKKDALLMTKVKILHLPMFKVTFTDLPSYMIQWTSPPFYFIYFREVSVTGNWVFWFTPTPTFIDWLSSRSTLGLPFNFSQIEFLHLWN